MMTNTNAEKAKYKIQVSGHERWLKEEKGMA